MGVRFRKAVSLGKGARINFSNSGASLSLGRPGASVSFGKRGTYANFSIPGTGLSMRTKLSGPSPRKSRAKSRPKKSTSSRRPAATSSSRAKTRPLSPERERALATLRAHSADGSTAQIQAGVSDEGEIVFFFGDTGELIADKDVLREVKKMPEVKASMPQLKEQQREIWRNIQASSEDASREFIEIYKLAPRVVTERTFTGRLAKLEPQKYVRPAFQKPQPTQAEIREALEAEANQNVTGFFGKKKKVQEYVDARWADFSDARIAAWKQELLAFEQEQDEIEKAENERLLREYEQSKASLEATLSEDDEVIADLVEDWLIDLTIPADVSAQTDCIDGKVYLDLDLPEIEDLPQTTTKQLKSGQVKVVDKTQKQLKQEYATCVLGLALFMAASIFNLNSNVSEVEISGYTQRRNKDGDIADDYIYSVRFPREKLRKLVIEDPVSDFNEFENRMKLSAAFTFSKIKPYEAPEVCEI